VLCWATLYAQCRYLPLLTNGGITSSNTQTPLQSGTKRIGAISGYKKEAASRGGETVLKKNEISHQNFPKIINIDACGGCLDRFGLAAVLKRAVSRLAFVITRTRWRRGPKAWAQTSKRPNAQTTKPPDTRICLDLCKKTWFWVLMKDQIVFRDWYRLE